MIFRTIREWERIWYGDGEDAIPQEYADRIADVARMSALSGSGGEGVLQHGRRWLKAQGVVGVVASPGCQLEILPKIEKVNEISGKVAHIESRRCLVQMLSVCYNLKVDIGNVASLDNQNHTLLEIITHLFCNKVIEAIRNGIPRQYIEHEDDLPNLRGRLNISRQLSVHSGMPEKLACQFDILSHNNPMSQVIRCALSKLMRVSRSHINQRKLRQIESFYWDVDEVPVRNLKWSSIWFDRSNSQWKDVFSFARLLILNCYQDTVSGSHEGYALLFDMSSLFEEYVARLTLSVLVKTKLRAVLQGGNKKCLYLEKREFHNTKPDLIIRKEGKDCMIADTKWKRLDATDKNFTHGIAQADVYQMMAYRQIYKCPTVMLLYPYHRDLSEIKLQRNYSIAQRDSAQRLIVATIDITDSFVDQKGRMEELISLGTEAQSL